MQRFPGCLYLEPSDVGFNAAVIGAGLTVSGPIVPALAEIPFDAVELLAVRAGVSVGVAIDVRQSVDGAAVIGGGITIVTAITGTTGCYGFINDTNSLSVGGLTMAANGRFGCFWPFIRFELRNTDGANAATVTLHVFLHQRVSA